MTDYRFLIINYGVQKQVEQHFLLMDGKKRIANRILTAREVKVK